MRRTERLHCFGTDSFVGCIHAGAENVESLQERIDNLGKKSEEYQNILNETETDISEKEAYGEALVNKINVINEKVILTRQAISSLSRISLSSSRKSTRITPTSTGR